MLREILEGFKTITNINTIYRGGGEPRYFEDKYSIGTWGHGIYFDTYKDEAEMYGDVKKYSFKGKLLNAEGTDILPKDKFDKIVKDLGLDLDWQKGEFWEMKPTKRFWSNVQSFIMQGKEKGLKQKDMFKIIKKHSGISGFLGSGHEVVLFIKEDVKEIK